MVSDHQGLGIKAERSRQIGNDDFCATWWNACKTCPKRMNRSWWKQK
jgi:hypothetical protein